MLTTSLRRTEEDKDMSAFKMTRAVEIVLATIVVAVVASPAPAASDRSSKFAPASGPEETIYRPECRIVQADGSWLPCVAGRDW
jgi:hypothetical protein